MRSLCATVSGNDACSSACCIGALHGLRLRLKRGMLWTCLQGPSADARQARHFLWLRVMQPDVKFFFTSLSRWVSIYAHVEGSLRPDALRSRQYKHGHVAVQACKDLYYVLSAHISTLKMSDWASTGIQASCDNTLPGHFRASVRIEFHLADLR